MVIAACAGPDRARRRLEVLGSHCSPEAVVTLGIGLGANHTAAEMAFHTAMVQIWEDIAATATCPGGHRLGVMTATRPTQCQVCHKRLKGVHAACDGGCFTACRKCVLAFSDGRADS